MIRTEKLKQELYEKPIGTRSNYVYLVRGFKKEAGSVSRQRANGCYALFTTPEPHIYKNDIIAGCIRNLWFEADENEANEANKTIKAMGFRWFGTNSDHYAPNYRKFVKLGIPGTLKEIEESIKTHANEPEKAEFAKDMYIAFSGFRELVKKYRDKALSLMGTEGYSDSDLKFIADNCTAILEGAPKTFAQGLQLVWFAHLAFLYEDRYAMALGRIDQYLYELYKKDIDAGIIDDERATELLENIFMKIYEIHAFTGGDDVVNIAIGGRDREGKSSVNALSLDVLHAVGNCNVPGPNLSCRVTPEMPDSFLDECLKVIGTGLGYPALMNDDINIAALSKYGYEMEDVYDYCMVGCIENLIAGCQPPWSDGRFDTPRFFEYIFNDGKAIKFPNDGICTGHVGDIKTMSQFMEKFEAQISQGVKEYVDFFNNFNIVSEPENLTQPFLSCFCDCCIERALDINMGGAKYPSVHGAALMGIGTVADSLAAVEKIVFEDKEADIETLADAIKNDFEGYEDLRQKLLAAPKYGNNDDFVDKYAVWYVDFLSEQFRKYKTYDGGGIYTAMASNISNIYAGAQLAATPDGRKAGEPLSDASSPTYGKDINGPTSTVLSLIKPDYSQVACGSVVNQKFSPSMFKGENRKQLLNLIRVYFAGGGQEMQINATSPDTLRDAMKYPEKYPEMVVRVSGFSAVYVNLTPEVQTDILHRTQHEAAS